MQTGDVHRVDFANVRRYADSELDRCWSCRNLARCSGDCHSHAEPPVAVKVNGSADARARQQLDEVLTVGKGAGLSEAQVLEQRLRQLQGKPPVPDGTFGFNGGHAQ